jgi:hypothetical protein
MGCVMGCHGHEAGGGRHRGQTRGQASGPSIWGRGWSGTGLGRSWVEADGTGDPDRGDRLCPSLRADYCFVQMPNPGGSTTGELRVSSRFALRGVWVRPEALGQAFTWDIDNYRVTLTLPQDQRDFLAEDEPEVPQVPALTPTARIDGSGDAVSVLLIKVDVEFSGPLSATTKATALESQASGDDEPINNFARVAQHLWEEGHEVAERVVHAWLNHVRVVSGQPWLGTAAEPPRQYGRSHISDGESGERLMSFGPMQSVTIRSGLLALSLDQLNEIREEIAAQEEPQVAAMLLADARFLAQEAEVVDSQRAILIAAMACEIKTKQSIRDKTDSSKAELLNLVLRRVSNLPELLDVTLQVALGLSLRTTEPPLYAKVKRLNELRNQVVHRGVQVDRTEGWQLVVASAQLFEWLDRLSPFTPT